MQWFQQWGKWIMVISLILCLVACSGGSSVTSVVPTSGSNPSPSPTMVAGSPSPGSSPGSASPTPMGSTPIPSPSGSAPTPVAEDDLDVVFPDLPPDPGEAGKKTVAGIDADGDGVRDDVQRYIYRTYSQDELKRKAMLQYAKAQQESLTNVLNREISIEKSNKLHRSAECVVAVYGDVRSTFGPLDILDAVIVNTKARVKADIQASVNYSGQIYTLLPYGQGFEACEF